MKFHWFHLMPYPHLPDDFKENYKSVWVDPPAGELYDPVKGHQVYNDYLDQLEFAERAGFDGICVNEHHQNGYGLMPSPNLMAAALARRTRKAKLVVLGNSVALYNPPIRVAEEMAMLDVMSGGRLVSGFPVGTGMDTAFCYGANPATLRDKYREGVELIVQGVEDAQAVRLQRQVHAAALRQSVAGADPDPASADLDSRRRQHRDLRVVREQQLPLRLLIVLGLRERPSGDGRATGRRSTRWARR